MIEPQNVPSTVQAPSAAKIVLATVVALVTAAIILVVAVLPAEYGIDPLGTGKALGLSHLAQATATPAPPPGSGEASIVPVLVPSTTGAPAMKGVFIAQPKAFKYDARTLTIDPHMGLEIKYKMKKGAGLVYSWTASVPVTFEFHGEPDVKPAGSEGTDYYESYEIDDTIGRSDGHGTFIAPSTGIHGWFWENTGDEPVTLALTSAGFYEWVFQNIKDKQTALQPMDPSKWPAHPAVPDEVVH